MLNRPTRRAIDRIDSLLLDDSTVTPSTNSGGSFVWRPGGVAGGNVYTTWASLYAAFSALAGAKTIWVDDSIVSPAIISSGGPYNVDGVTFTSRGNFNNGNGAAVVQVESGATMTATYLEVKGLILIESSSSTPVLNVASDVECNIFVKDNAEIVGGTSSFVSINASGFAWFWVWGGILGAKAISSGGGGGNLEVDCFGGELSTGSIVGSGLIEYDASSTLGTLTGFTGTLNRITVAALAEAAFGTTGARPAGTTLVKTGQMYFDTTLGFPVWWNGTTWVNSVGTPS